MIESLLQSIADFGPVLLFVITFLSCLALPVPSSLVMLTGGGFVAAGDLPLWSTFGAAFAGAVLGDQIGFAIGRLGGGRLQTWLGATPPRARLREQAQALILRWGGVGVFLSRWLFSPLGPYLNFAAGASVMQWHRFTVWGVAGEAVWVSLYLGLGYMFAGHAKELADVLGNTSGFLAAGVVMACTGLWLWKSHRKAGNAPRG
ncbi:MAG: membrane protein DedA with SNARE-associated domain [Paracoccaceae bacterium]|jgi:membrane protein DedA with SNARE-associated domain|tara:strand:+ start:106 stop:714 length:609 start_codon:yes stop_codon:yes gene_type:complete